MNDQNNEPGFKFVDKRRFDETGEARHVEGEDEHKEAAPTQAVPSQAVPSQAVPPKPAENEDHAQAHGPITFSLFLQSLASQAVMSMGILPWPDSNEVIVNLDHARETISILEMLHDKTKGNLTAEEQRFFDSVLYELRMTFVEVQKGGGGR